MHERHGDATPGNWTRLYRIWVAMRQRCNDPKRDGFMRYGGRGIMVCPEWEFSFPTFKEWAMTNGYRDDLSIDRLDVNGHYEPSNCRWATQKEQMSNTHRACLVTVSGATHTVKEWADLTGIIWSTLYKRYHKGVRGAAFIAKPAPVRKGPML